MRPLLPSNSQPFLLVSLFYLLIIPSLTAQIYVRAGATGKADGTSWQNAYPLLQNALAAAAEGETLHLGAGTYFTDPNQVDTTLSFIVDRNMILLGGFAGTGANPDERDPTTHLTILSGDLNGDDLAGDLDTNRTDNAVHVLKIASAVTNAAMLDGLIIQGGVADMEADSTGGGILMVGTPRLRNCTIRENMALLDGGGISSQPNVASGEQLIIENCRFENNRALNIGAGMYSETTVLLTNCTFQNNRSEDDGGGLYLVGAAAAGSVLRKCHFEANFSGQQAAGAMVEGVHDEGVRVETCTFHENFASYGSGLIISNSNSKVTSCRFTSNESLITAGGMSVSYPREQNGLSSTIDSCHFNGNTATYGGALMFYSLTPEKSFSLTNSTFHNNRTVRNFDDRSPDGGAFYFSTRNFAANNQVLVENCDFTENESPLWGGAMTIAHGGPNGAITFRRNRLSKNRGQSHGGAMELFLRESATGTRIEIDSCKLTENSSSFGGAVRFVSFAPESRITWKKTEITRNTAEKQVDYDVFGASTSAILNHVAETATNNVISLDSCLIAANTATNIGAIGTTLIGERARFEFTNNRVEENLALGRTGGGLDFLVLSPHSDLSFDHSSFVKNRNEESVGGGINLFVGEGDSVSVAVTNSYFSENYSATLGGGLRVGSRENATNLMVRVDSCLFENNIGSYGGGFACDGSGQRISLSLTNSQFIGNETQPQIEGVPEAFGGAVCIYNDQGLDTKVLIDNCSFLENNSSHFSGGLDIYTHDSENQQFDVVNSTFRNNRALRWGGGFQIYTNSNDSLNIRQCQFIDNSADDSGGGILLGATAEAFKARISHTIWDGNSSKDGAAVSVFYKEVLEFPIPFVYPEGAAVQIDNSLFINNASETATIIVDSFPSLTLINNTLADNTAEGVHLRNQSGLVLQNNLFSNPGFDTYRQLAEDNTYISLGGNLTMDQSILIDETTVDIVNADPVLDTDYRLSEGSPAIDAGVLPENHPEFDLAGKPRIDGNGIDIGAFESSFSAVPVRTYWVDNSALKLSPNPASDVLTLFLDNGWRGLLYMDIYNQLGQSVFHRKGFKTDFSFTRNLPVTQLPAGTYFLVVHDGVEGMQQLFVIQ